MDSGVPSLLFLFLTKFEGILTSVDTHGQARGTFKTIQASLDLNPGFSGIVHI